ncbi:hypothetical protein KR51_00005530 [Rubidibacter lacunae KORDI 51-2]|uniref:Uncharacterized protein n=1 Tax=Rubidibacter lacunae KORDI 51-2 TaxID=582515 RepID=U5DM04_9CHRO|nr:hypothetical protein [Rubidibacter lacunae]ERN42706.1 hypothetical protein KR51_00005530 [Rubidibacter lacunae KORDI 51-2]
MSCSPHWVFVRSLLGPVTQLFCWRSFGLVWSGAIAFWLILNVPARSQETVSSIAPPIACPHAIEPLMVLLLRDYPNYANRAIARSRLANDEFDFHVVAAGRLEFEPLPLSADGGETDIFGRDRGVVQVFFTTLERSYQNYAVVSTQQYHWLLLTPSGGGWRLVMAFTRLGGKTADGASLPQPPLNTTDRIVGQVVKTWLHDCRNGRIRADLSEAARATIRQEAPF